MSRFGSHRSQELSVSSAGLEPKATGEAPPGSAAGSGTPKLFALGTTSAGDGGPFTAYLRAFGQGDAGLSGPAFDAFWQALGAALRRELRRRGLWDAPPRFLGIEEPASWNTEALEELTTDCYVYVLQRLRALERQLEMRSEVEGLVLLNVKHFVFERQKLADPVGFRVYEVLRGAVRLALGAGAITIDGGDSDLDNRTRLSWPVKEKPSTANEATDQAMSSIAEQARLWADDLLPELMLARGRNRDAVSERLAEALGQLGEAGVRSASFKQLADAFKREVRGRWGAFWARESAEPDDEGSTRVGNHWIAQAVAPPGTGFESRQSFERLAACVELSVDRLATRGGQGAGLAELWHFLQSLAPDPGVASLPSQRRVAEELGIPRYRMTTYYSALRRIVEGCQRRLRRPGREVGK